LGVLDFLDALFGQPGWTRDHRLAWDGFTSPGPSGLTRFQQMLQGRIEEALLQAGFTVGQWERSPSEEAGAIHADIAGTGLRIWLDRNAAAFGRTIKRGRVVPDRVYEEWGSRTPDDLIAALLYDLRRALKSEHLIAVLPKNYRRIALYAIESAAKPVVLMNGKPIDDFSESGPLTQKGIRPCRDFEVRDGATPMLGFHDHPDQMWVAGSYRALAEHCAGEGWLKIQRPAS
jgi:hypothetical protein